MTAGYDFTLLGALRHRSSMYNQRQEQFRSNPLTTVDLGVGVATSDDRFGVDLIVRNVNNDVEEDFASPSVDPRFSPGAYAAAPSRLRTVLLTGRARF